MIGEQYQNHNPRPGPVYAGGGYTPTTQALHDGSIGALLKTYPDLVNDISTGGATPLHMCGMSRSGERSTAAVIELGGDIEAQDTYGASYTRLDVVSNHCERRHERGHDDHGSVQLAVPRKWSRSRVLLITHASTMRHVPYTQGTARYTAWRPTTSPSAQLPCSRPAPTPAPERPRERTPCRLRVQVGPGT